MKGFSLLEMLVSTAILSIIMFAVYGAYTSNLSSIKRTQDEMEVWQTSRVILERMTRDIESTFVGTRGNMNSRDWEIQGMQADKISFTSVSHLAMYESDIRTDLCQVDYYLTKADGKGYMTLMRSEKIAAGTGFARNSLTQEMTDTVMDLKVDFLDENGISTGEWAMEDGAPSLITIHLILGDNLGKGHEFMTSVRPGITRL